MRQFWNKTKVVCTIGPACSSPDMMKKMIVAGMDVARFNFSHGVPAQQSASMRRIRSVARGLKATLAVLQDLPGPKIRLGRLAGEYVELKAGERFFLTSRAIIGDARGVGVNHPAFVRHLKKKDVVFLNDGLVKLLVVSRSGDAVHCEVLTGGRIYPKKGVNSPSNILTCGAVTAYDLACIEQGIRASADFTAISFVQSARDIEKVRLFLKKRNSAMSIVAKIERKVAFEDIDRIIDASDAVMVARGDLGIEAPLEEVPFLQKEIIMKCNRQGKPVITATQMLESMVHSPQPTRAEVTDVANAVLDGTDALMLSEETAIGKHPLAALTTMITIAAQAEQRLSSFAFTRHDVCAEQQGLLEAFSYSAVKVAAQVRARLIIVPTKNAGSVSWLSRLRPECAVAAITPSELVFKKLILSWGVFPILMKKMRTLPETLQLCESAVKAQGLLRKNDRVVILLTKDNQLFSANIMELRSIE